MNNKLIGLTIGAAISILCLATILIPVIEDAQHSGAEVFTNGAPMGNLVGNDSIDIIITNENKIITEGEVISGYNYEAILSDGLVIAVNNGGANLFWTTENTGHWSAIRGANVHIDGANKLITLSSINHAPTNDNITGDTLEIPYVDFCYYRAASGDFTEIRNPTVTSLHVYDANQIYAAAYSTYLYAWTGNVTYVNGVSGDSGITLTPLESEPKVSSISQIVENSAQPQWIAVPTAVYGESVMDVGSAQLLGAIPVMILVAILAGVITCIIARGKQ